MRAPGPEPGVGLELDWWELGRGGCGLRRQGQARATGAASGWRGLHAWDSLQQPCTNEVSRRHKRTAHPSTHAPPSTHAIYPDLTSPMPSRFPHPLPTPTSPPTPRPPSPHT